MMTPRINSGPEIRDVHIEHPPANSSTAIRVTGGRGGVSRHPPPSDGAVVRLLPTGLGQRLHHEEGDGAQEADHHQDEQLPVQQQVVAVGERHRRHDGLWKENQACLEESLMALMNGRSLQPPQLKFKPNLNQADWRVSNMIGSAAPTCVNLKAAKAGALSSRNMKPMMLSSCVL